MRVLSALLRRAGAATTCRRQVHTSATSSPRVCIIGGGGVGSSCAHWLAKRGCDVVVVERDPSYKFASTALSVGSIRQQFSTPENIQMSLFGAHFLRDVCNHLGVEGEDCQVNFFEGGYLFLASDATGADVLRRNHRVQKQYGADNVFLTPEELRVRFPWINTEGISLGCLGLSLEGWFDPYSLLCAFKRKAISNGAKYIHGDVVGVNKNQVTVHTANGTTESIACTHIVNAAGPFARRVCAMAGVTPVPVFPRKREVFVFKTNADLTNCPLTIDPTGVYIRRESPKGNTYLCGTAPEVDPDCTHTDDLVVNPDSFETHLWPVLAERFPALEDLRVVTSWAGFYEFNTFDHNGIIGAHTEMPNMILANGFSGHGIQQAAATGRAVSELIMAGKFETLDLRAFRFERIAEGQPIVEENVV